MPIPCHAEAFVPLPIEDVFERAAGRTDGLARYFGGHRPLVPSIRSARLLDRDDPPVAGALREVRLGDGTRIVERVLAFEAPRLHRYEMAEMNRLQRLLCSNMVGEWRFATEGAGTRVVWDYVIHEHGLAGRLLGRLVARSFERAMQSCLDAIARDARS
jgi:hypothetical protein